MLGDEEGQGEREEVHDTGEGENDEQPGQRPEHGQARHAEAEEGGEQGQEG